MFVNKVQQKDWALWNGFHDVTCTSVAQELLPAEASVSNWETSGRAAHLLQSEHGYSTTCITNSTQYGANVINNAHSFARYTQIFIRNNNLKKAFL